MLPYNSASPKALETPASINITRDGLLLIDVIGKKTLPSLTRHKLIPEPRSSLNNKTYWFANDDCVQQYLPVQISFVIKGMVHPENLIIFLAACCLKVLGDYRRPFQNNENE